MIAMNQDLFNQFISAEKPVLVEFWAPWCVYCRRISPALEKLQEQLGAELTIAQVNIDEEPLLANQEQIEVIPTLILYQNGQALDSIVAPESKAKIEEFINRTLNK